MPPAGPRRKTARALQAKGGQAASAMSCQSSQNRWSVGPGGRDRKRGRAPGPEATLRPDMADLNRRDPSHKMASSAAGQSVTSMRSTFDTLRRDPIGSETAEGSWQQGCGSVALVPWRLAAAPESGALEGSARAHRAGGDAWGSDSIGQRAPGATGAGRSGGKGGARAPHLASAGSLSGVECLSVSVAQPSLGNRARVTDHHCHDSASFDPDDRVAPVERSEASINIAAWAPPAARRPTVVSRRCGARRRAAARSGRSGRRAIDEALGALQWEASQARARSSGVGRTGGDAAERDDANSRDPVDRVSQCLALPGGPPEAGDAKDRPETSGTSSRGAGVPMACMAGASCAGEGASRGGEEATGSEGGIALGARRGWERGGVGDSDGEQGENS
eukprot:evm.model.scf_1068.7 EVM.evm.TU.scf_1068.7   scf_1068:50647-51816(+)